ncbi:uroporphyrinogen-III synthase [Sediminibacillus massiliensis]|uniref:uroporphyrinogen-III synthase n=1 Tax=Sediminibacillus massiliensis TaxID=1926277 RepID=UPI000988522D|nr:uroporphyrinogen-III synthase [Sediminibacillus massiliensis]
MQELTGKQIGLAADRKSEALSEIIRKKGGTPVVRSIQGQRLLNEKKAEEDVEHLIQSQFDWVILTTGIGAEALEQAANRIGRLDAYIDSLQQTKLAVRGSKTVAWMKKWGLQPAFTSPDGTMDQLINGLKSQDIHGRQFFFQAYNKDEERLIKQLESLPITIYISMPYYYLPPETNTLENLRASIVHRELDAVIFTSKTQVQNLFTDSPNKQGLLDAFRNKVVAVAVGKVTGEELLNAGIQRVVEPDKPKMGAMIIALANHFSKETT